jgi:hypothetical protein
MVTQIIRAHDSSQSSMERGQTLKFEFQRTCSGTITSGTHLPTKSPNTSVVNILQEKQMIKAWRLRLPETKGSLDPIAPSIRNRPLRHRICQG